MKREDIKEIINKKLNEIKTNKNYFANAKEVIKGIDEKIKPENIEKTDN